MRIQRSKPCVATIGVDNAKIWPSEVCQYVPYRLPRMGHHKHRSVGPEAERAAEVHEVKHRLREAGPEPSVANILLPPI